MFSPKESPLLAGANLPPSPSGVVLLGNFPELKKNPLGTLTRYSREMGGVVRIRFPSYSLYFLTQPDHIKHVLQDNFANFTKRTRGWDKLRPLFGEGLLTSDGPTWLKQRRTMQPAFHHQRIKHFVSIFSTEALRMVDRWKEAADKGKPVNVAEEMMSLTFRIVTSALFTQDMKEEVATVGWALSAILHCASENYLRIIGLPLWVPIGINRQAKKGLKALNQIVYRIIEKRRKSPGGQQDLLSMLMEARDPETGQVMSDREIRDQVMTIFMTGHETTALALTWTWYMLSKFPLVENKLNEEISRVLGGHTPEWGTIEKLDYTQKVFKETLRLFPPIWVFSRRCIKDDVIGGYRIPAGSTVVICPYALHRDPAFFKNPELFDPDRFTSGKIDPPPPYNYIPFGGGSRLCIGRDIALMEAGVIIPIVLQHFKLSLLPGHTVEEEPTITLRPRYGMMMSLTKR